MRHGARGRGANEEATAGRGAGEGPRGRARDGGKAPRHGARHGGGAPAPGEDSVRVAAKRGGAKAPSQRQLRVGEEVRHVLAGVFGRTEFRDPELTDVQITVTEVRLSPDLKHATAFVARLGRSDVEAVLPALRRVAPFLRGQVAHALRLRVAPEITFQPDEALEYAMHVEELLHRPEVLRDLGEPDEAEGDG